MTEKLFTGTLNKNQNKTKKQPLYNTIVWVEANFRVSYPNRVITRVKYSYIAKSVLNDHLGSSTDPCYIQNRVISNRVIKRLMCICTKCLHVHICGNLFSQISVSHESRENKSLEKKLV